MTIVIYSAVVKRNISKDHFCAVIPNLNGSVECSAYDCFVRGIQNAAKNLCVSSAARRCVISRFTPM
jgi:hypothetical protein